MSSGLNFFPVKNRFGIHSTPAHFYLLLHATGAESELVSGADGFGFARSRRILRHRRIYDGDFISAIPNAFLDQSPDCDVCVPDNIARRFIDCSADGGRLFYHLHFGHSGNYFLRAEQLDEPDQRTAWYRGHSFDFFVRLRTRRQNFISVFELDIDAYRLVSVEKFVRFGFRQNVACHQRRRDLRGKHRKKCLSIESHFLRRQRGDRGDSRRIICSLYFIY